MWESGPCFDRFGDGRRISPIHMREGLALDLSLFV
jgi:hypothetical protein